MAFDWPEQNEDYGIFGVTIEQTLSDPYDPFSGINLLEDYRQACSHLEIMLLPNQSIVDDVYCQDPFASTGPESYGGTGGLGHCFNNGAVNVRYLGGDVDGNADEESLTNANVLPWYQEGLDNGETHGGATKVTEPFQHPSPGSGWPDVWKPNVWGYDDGSGATITASPYSNQQISSFNFDFAGNTSPFSGNEDPNYNLAEMRSYITMEETGIYRFCVHFNDSFGLFINDGIGGELRLAAEGPDISADGVGFSYGDYTTNLENGSYEGDPSRVPFHVDLSEFDGDANLYKILVRHVQKNDSLEAGTKYKIDIAYQTPTSRAFYGDLPCDESFTELFYLGAEKLYPTEVNPPMQQEYEVDELSGDGFYYDVNQTPFYGTEEIYDVLQTADCNTEFEIPLYNFDELRAVCKDGSYVTVASTQGGGVPLLTPPDYIGETTETEFLNPTLPGSDIQHLTIEQNNAIFQQQQENPGFDWMDLDYYSQEYNIGFWDVENIVDDTLTQYCLKQGYNDGYIAYTTNAEYSPNYGRHIGDEEGGYIGIRQSDDRCYGPYPDLYFEDADPDTEVVIGEYSWEDWCNQQRGLFDGTDNCNNYANIDDMRHDAGAASSRECCASVYGLTPVGADCSRHSNPGYNESDYHYNDDYKMWPAWWDMSYLPTDYKAEFVGEDDNLKYYKCLDNIVTITEPNIDRIMVYWDTPNLPYGDDWGWIVMPWESNDAGGGGNSADFVWITSVTCRGDLSQSNFIYRNGEEACKTYTTNNSDLFYASDADERPSLGLFSTVNDNKLSDKFQSSIVDDTFTQLPINNLVRNSTGIGESGAIHELKWDTWLDGESTKNIYYPDSWEHIAYNGTVERLDTGFGNDPTDERLARFIQSPTYEPSDDFPAYGGAFLYAYPNVNYEWNNSGISLYSGDGDPTGDGYVGEEIASIEHDFQWARWVRGNSECLSYNKCLKFQADSKWDNIEDLLTNANNLEPDQDISVKNTYRVLELRNENQYRTINQSQKIFDRNINAGLLNPFTSLNVSFYMKTMSDDLYESVNPPEVESGVMKASNLGFHDDYLGSITYDFGGGGGYWDDCGFAFVPDILPDDHAQCDRPPCYYWRLATELLPENSGLTDQGNPVNYFDNCGIGDGGNQSHYKLSCSGIISPPSYTPSFQQYDDYQEYGMPIYSAKDDQGNIGEAGKCISVPMFQFHWEDTPSCYDPEFNNSSYNQDFNEDGEPDIHWYHSIYNPDTEWHGNNRMCPEGNYPYCTYDMWRLDKPIEERYFCSSHVQQQPTENIIIHNDNYWDAQGYYNSFGNWEDANTTETFDLFGCMHRFKNDALNVWEKKEFTFNITQNYIDSFENVRDMSFFVQAGNEFRGTVYLDNFEVKESYEFVPDVDVRQKLATARYGKGDLTKYYDPTIPEQLEAYLDTVAPLEAQFYFYPRYFKEDVFGKTHPVFNDFRKGMFYLFDVDWGDGSPKEFTNEPLQLGDNEMIYHTFEEGGIYDITGYMIRLKYDKDNTPIGVVHNRRFTLTINISTGREEDFTYFGSEGFSFIPYENTYPIVGGYSKNSIYYKSIKRNLGILEDEQIQTSFKYIGDRLKTELALNKMDSSNKDFFQVLPTFEQERYTEPDGNGDLVFSGISNTFPDELGSTIGDVDITNIRYFNKPRELWEMFVPHNSTEYETFIDPNYEEPIDNWTAGGDGIGEGALPEDYAESDDPIVTTCLDDQACNYEGSLPCIYPENNELEFEAITASVLTEDMWVWNWTLGMSEQIDAVMNTGMGVDCGDGHCTSQYEGVIIWQSDIPGPPITVDTNTLLTRLIGPGEKMDVRLNGERIFVNSPAAEWDSIDEWWYDASPYATQEFQIYEGDVLTIVLANSYSLNPENYYDGREYEMDTGDTLTIPYLGCPSPSGGTDMNYYPFGEVLAGGTCYHTAECKQYGDEIVDYFDQELFFRFNSYCIDNVCTVSCGDTFVKMPCYSDEHCSEYNHYQQPDCIQHQYTCDFTNQDEDGAGICSGCVFYGNPSWNAVCENGEYGENNDPYSEECAECGNRSCVGEMCQGGENVGGECDPEDVDEKGYPNDCPCKESPYQSFPNMCVGGTSYETCLQRNDQLQNVTTGCDEHGTVVCYVCPDPETPFCDDVYGDGASAACSSFCDESCYVEVFTDGPPPGTCKWLEGVVFSALLGICFEGGTCVNGMCIDDLLGGDDVNRQGNMRSLLHPGNPGSPRYWKNIIPKDFDIIQSEFTTHQGREGLKYYRDTSDGYLSTLPFPTYFEEFDISSELGQEIKDKQINQLDLSYWNILGREDISIHISDILIGAVEMPPNWVDLTSQEKQELTNDGLGLKSSSYYRNPTSVNVDPLSEQGWDGFHPELGYRYYYPVLPKFNQGGSFTDPPEYPYENIPLPLEGPITDDKYHDSALKISINSEEIDTNVLDDKSGNNNKGFPINDFRPLFDNETLKIEKTKNLSRMKKSTKNGAF